LFVHELSGMSILEWIFEFLKISLELFIIDVYKNFPTSTNPTLYTKYSCTKKFFIIDSCVSRFFWGGGGVEYIFQLKTLEILNNFLFGTIFFERGDGNPPIRPTATPLEHMSTLKVEHHLWMAPCQINLTPLITPLLSLLKFLLVSASLIRGRSLIMYLCFLGGGSKLKQKSFLWKICEKGWGGLKTGYFPLT